MIELFDVTFCYPAPQGEPKPVLRGVNLTFRQGESAAIVGANGSGKTTLARHLNGLLLPTQGVVRVDGLDTRVAANRRKILTAVGIVFQFPEDQIVGSVVEEDLAFGLENLGLPPEEIRSRVDAALQDVNLWEERRRSPHQLSAGQTQRLALAGVLVMQPRYVIFDEATSMLDPKGRAKALALMDRCRQTGISVLSVTHSMDEAATMDRIVVMHRGQVVLQGTPEEVFRDAEQLSAWGLELPQAMRAAQKLSVVFPSLTGRAPLRLADLDAHLPAFTGEARPPAPRQNHDESDEPLTIEARDLDHVYLQGTPLAHTALDGVNLSVPEGRSWGLLGATGSGKSTVLQHLNGLLRPQRGVVKVAGFNLNDERLPIVDVVKKVGLVFQNPEQMFFETYVGDEIAYGLRQTGAVEIREKVRAAMETVGLDFDLFKDRVTATLSGGEKRKVAVAATLALRPAVLLLDEPTAGLDPQARKEMLKLLAQMKKNGVTLVLSSHQMEDMAVLADGVTVFKKGKTALEGPINDLLSDEEALRPNGLEPTFAAQVAGLLRAKGWPLRKDVIRMDELISEALGAMGAAQ